MAKRPTGPQPQTATVSPGWMSAVLRAHVAGGEDVGEEEDLVVGEIRLDLDGADIGEGDADVLRLTAGVTAVDVRVAEEAEPGVAAHRSPRSGRWGWSCRSRLQSVFWQKRAAAAGDGEGDHDAVARLEVVDVRANLFDDAHELVAENVAGLPWWGCSRRRGAGRSRRWQF